MKERRPSRQEIDSRIEAYARAVRQASADAVAALFAERVDHVVHGLATSQGPWNTKREDDREGIRRLYKEFFEAVPVMDVRYTDRLIDEERNAAAMTVRVQLGHTVMENALHIAWNEQGQIVRFYNWYGEGTAHERD